MVVEVLVPQGDGDHALSEHGTLIVDDESGITGVGDHRVDGVKQADLLGHLAKQQRAPVGREPSALEIRNDLLAVVTGKVEGTAVTLRHDHGLSVVGVWLSQLQSLPYVRPCVN